MMGARVAASPSRGQRSRLPPWIVSWLQVGPLALILVVLFVLPTGLFLVVSFFDYDRVGIYPAFLLDNYHDLLTTPATWRVYISSLKFAVIVWAITLFLGFNIAYFLIFHIRSATYPHGAVPAVRHSVLDVGDHPHDRLDPIPWPQRSV